MADPKSFEQGKCNCLETLKFINVSLRVGGQWSVMPRAVSPISCAPLPIADRGGGLQIAPGPIRCDCIASCDQRCSFTLYARTITGF